MENKRYDEKQRFDEKKRINEDNKRSSEKIYYSSDNGKENFKEFNDPIKTSKLNHKKQSMNLSKMKKILTITTATVGSAVVTTTVIIVASVKIFITGTNISEDTVSYTINVENPTNSPLVALVSSGDDFYEQALSSGSGIKNLSFSGLDVDSDYNFRVVNKNDGKVLISSDFKTDRPETIIEPVNKPSTSNPNDNYYKPSQGSLVIETKTENVMEDKLVDYLNGVSLGEHIDSRKFENLEYDTTYTYEVINETTSKVIYSETFKTPKLPTASVSATPTDNSMVLSFLIDNPDNLILSASINGNSYDLGGLTSKEITLSNLEEKTKVNVRLTTEKNLVVLEDSFETLEKVKPIIEEKPKPKPHHHGGGGSKPRPVVKETAVTNLTANVIKHNFANEINVSFNLINEKNENLELVLLDDIGEIYYQEEFTNKTSFNLVEIAQASKYNIEIRSITNNKTLASKEVLVSYEPIIEEITFTENNESHALNLKVIANNVSEVPLKVVVSDTSGKEEILETNYTSYIYEGSYSLNHLFDGGKITVKVLKQDGTLVSSKDYNLKAQTSAKNFDIKLIENKEKTDIERIEISFDLVNERKEDVLLTAFNSHLVIDEAHKISGTLEKGRFKYVLANGAMLVDNPDLINLATATKYLSSLETKKEAVGFASGNDLKDVGLVGLTKSSSGTETLYPSTTYYPSTDYNTSSKQASIYIPAHYRPSILDQRTMSNKGSNILYNFTVTNHDDNHKLQVVLVEKTLDVTSIDKTKAPNIDSVTDFSYTVDKACEVELKAVNGKEYLLNIYDTKLGEYLLVNDDTYISKASSNAKLNNVVVTRSSTTNYPTVKLDFEAELYKNVDLGDDDKLYLVIRDSSDTRLLEIALNSLITTKDKPFNFSINNLFEEIPDLAKPSLDNNVYDFIIVKDNVNLPNTNTIDISKPLSQKLDVVLDNSPVRNVNLSYDKVSNNINLDYEVIDNTNQIEFSINDEVISAVTDKGKQSLVITSFNGSNLLDFKEYVIKIKENISGVNELVYTNSIITDAKINLSQEHSFLVLDAVGNFDFTDSEVYLNGTLVTNENIDQTTKNKKFIINQSTNNLLVDNEYKIEVKKTIGSKANYLAYSGSIIYKENESTIPPLKSMSPTSMVFDISNLTSGEIKVKEVYDGKLDKTVTVDKKTNTASVLDLEPNNLYQVSYVVNGMEVATSNIRTIEYLVHELSTNSLSLERMLNPNETYTYVLDSGVEQSLTDNINFDLTSVNKGSHTIKFMDGVTTYETSFNNELSLREAFLTNEEGYISLEAPANKVLEYTTGHMDDRFSETKTETNVRKVLYQPYNMGNNNSNVDIKENNITIAHIDIVDDLTYEFNAYDNVNQVRINTTISNNGPKYTISNFKPMTMEESTRPFLVKFKDNYSEVGPVEYVDQMEVDISSLNGEFKPIVLIRNIDGDLNTAQMNDYPYDLPTFEFSTYVDSGVTPANNYLRMLISGANNYNMDLIDQQTAKITLLDSSGQVIRDNINFVENTGAIMDIAISETEAANLDSITVNGLAIFTGSNYTDHYVTFDNYTVKLKNPVI